MTDSYPLDQHAALPAEDIAAAWTRERPGAPVGSIRVITPLWRIAKRLADHRRALLTRAGADAATLDLLSTLRRSGTPYTMTTRQLAEATLVTAGAISQRVARAEREGLVTRARSTTRARSVEVTLTEAGHALVESLVDDILVSEDDLLDGLDEPQREQLAALLATWWESLRQRDLPSYQPFGFVRLASRPGPSPVTLSSDTRHRPVSEGDFT
ncbi:MarR family winged helix-turn-helix transcriptional regulator [Stackebrandtia nassauensis]|uniref:Transcriptional regulator, MarR family n=1 Tax=Stackebrandtia nassauensis (strain DSM 44728 / CIP 108903 / NRRL B-16338 / NBRC 102104 / LLR-40K-21) TaxID=446470 RepID=D3Q9S1_STANL|nr:MarR family transcriptional regulator [Stackebrandtia nassauensis]ADD44617.1 transcriptional regulator, MarR family [Stackebrandtia nassauensis DSM 44728]